MNTYTPANITVHFLEEEADQEGNVLHSLAEGGDGDRELSEPVKRVLPEPPLLEIIQGAAR
jgi:hypothetical protein